MVVNCSTGYDNQCSQILKIEKLMNTDCAVYRETIDGKQNIQGFPTIEDVLSAEIYLGVDMIEAVPTHSSGLITTTLEYTTAYQLLINLPMPRSVSDLATSWSDIKYKNLYLN